MTVMVCDNQVLIQTMAGLKNINLSDLNTWEKASVEKALSELGFKHKVESNCYRMQWSHHLVWESDIKEFDEDQYHSPLYYLNCSAKWEY